MLICLDEIQVTVDDIPLGTELAELGAWSECRPLFDRPNEAVYGLCNNSPVNSEAGELDSKICA